VVYFAKMANIDNKPIPTNEEVIDELTKDLESSLLPKPPEDLVTSSETQSCQDNQRKEENASSNKDEEKNFVPSDFEADDPEDKSQDDPGFDDYVDEVALKDLEMTYSEEDREVKATLKLVAACFMLS